MERFLTFAKRFFVVLCLLTVLSIPAKAGDPDTPPVVPTDNSNVVVPGDPDTPPVTYDSQGFMSVLVTIWTITVNP